MSILGGCCCGILGLTNWSGFAFYLVTALLTSVVLLGKLAATAAASGGLADAKSYVGSLSAITTDGLIDGCMSYVLFWTYDQQRGTQGVTNAVERTASVRWEFGDRQPIDRPLTLTLFLLCSLPVRSVSQVIV